jgi:hypothetical protein
MILETMDLYQACAEAKADFDAIKDSTTLSRLQADYGRSRIKAKVAPSAKWHKTYKIKTKRKNTWMIIIERVSSKDRSVYCTMVVYYYTSKGIRAIAINMNADGRESYIVTNSHTVKRWNERLNKGIVQPLDMFEAYFNKNDEVIFKLLKNEADEVFGVVDGGFLIGNKHGEKITVVKTFINRELAGMTQLQYEAKIRETMEEDLAASRPTAVLIGKDHRQFR